MSLPSPALSPMIQRADETAGEWIIGLLDGKGNTPSHAIVTAVLGCVPIVGQLFDLRDLLRNIIALNSTPTSVGLWVELLINLIGCVPGLGDTFKAAFKLARSGYNANRVFDAMRSYARINPREGIKSLDWDKIRRESLHIFIGMLDNLVVTLDRWLIKLVAGHQKADELITALKQLKRQAPEMIDNAIIELRKTMDELLSHPQVVSTAQVSGVQRSLPVPSAPHASGTSVGTGQKAEQHKPIVDNTGENHVPRGQTPTVYQIRQSKRKRWSSGVPAEHIVEYYVQRVRSGVRKINDFGRLTEEWESSKKIGGTTVRQSAVNSHGIDHLWFGRHRGRLYTVGETKGSVWAQFSFLAGMNETDKKAVEDTRSDTAKVLDDKQAYSVKDALKTDDDTVHYTTIDNEKALADADKKTGTLSATKGKGRQMSHLWIKASIQNDPTISITHKDRLSELILSALSSTNPYPYNREVFMVTGRQYEMHDRSKGAIHKPQLPIIIIPDKILVS